MRRPRLRTFIVAGLAAGGAVAAKRSIDARVASWSTNHDTCAGDPLRLPDGEAVTVRAADGATLHGIDCGEGPTVLLVHCWTGNPGFWGPVACRLVDAGFRVVAVTQRGHGASDRGDAPYSPETLGDDVRTWLETLDLHDVVLSGHSMGGLASMALATGHPDVARDRVRGLVLVATLASPPSDPRRPDLDISRLLPLADFVYRRGDLGLFGLLGVFGTRPARSQLEAARDGFLDADPVTRREAAEMMTRFDLRPDLPGVDLPTTVVAGTHDQLTPLALNEDIAERIPGARLEVLHGLGHMLPWEAPDQVTDVIVQTAKPA
ncbi:MAG: alpha/beta hydrolase [Acidimicrobiales bacterium]|nr:alpha/beta hydrolase [Acidimicrobiales bacterium]